jgi:hypothetical protein
MKVTVSNLKKLHVLVTTGQHAALRHLAYERDTSMAAVVRTAIGYYLEDCKLAGELAAELIAEERSNDAI